MPNQEHFYQGIDLHGNNLKNARVNDVPNDAKDIVNLEYLKDYVNDKLEDSGLTPSFKEGYVKYVKLHQHPNNSNQIVVNNVYSLLIVVESIYNDRPTSTSPTITLKRSNSAKKYLENITLESSNYGITLEANQFLFKYTSTDYDMFLSKTDCIFILSQIFDAIGDKKVFNFEKDISSEIFDNNHLIISPYIGLITQLEITTPPVVNGNSIPILGIGSNIGMNVSKTSLIPETLNSLVVLVPNDRTSIAVDFINDDNQVFQSIIFPINDLMVKGDGTQFSQKPLITWNGIVYKKGLLHLGYITQSNLLIKLS